MTILKMVSFLLICLVIFTLGFLAEPSSSAIQPNPMKVNKEQFERVMNMDQNEAYAKRNSHP